MNRLIFFCLLLCCTGSSVVAQQNFSISGTIRDNKETLPGAAVYVSGYKMATVTNSDGKFILPNLKPGNYDILVQMIGYYPIAKNVIITDRSTSIDILLKENTTSLKEVVVKPDPNRDFLLNLFKQYFIGVTPNAKSCRILNTEVINVNEDRSARLFTVSAPDLLIIENQALGYRIKYLLQTFEYDYSKKIIFYAGQPTFEEMKGSRSKQRKWQKNREVAYYGSAQQFFQSLYRKTLMQDGFLLYKLKTVKNTQRPPDSLINAKIRQLTTGAHGVKNLLTFNGGNDSLSYWLRQRSLPPNLKILDKSPIALDTLVKVSDDVLREINFTNTLYVVYKNAKEDPYYENTGFKVARPQELGNAQVSLIDLLNAPLKFYPNGATFDARATLYSGYWSYKKVADLLPLNYIPPSKEN